MKNFSTKKLALTALFVALVCGVTLTVRIPSGIGNGYINIGDSVIFMCAYFLGPIPALIAGGLGSCFADLCGYAHWALATLIIKGLEGLVCGYCIQFFNWIFNKKNINKIWLRYLGLFISMLIAALVMFVGYFFGGWVINGYGGAIASLAGNAIQGSISIAIAFPLIYMLSNVAYVRREFNVNSFKKENKNNKNTNEEKILTKKIEK